MSHFDFTNNTNGAQAVDMMALLGRCMGNFKIVERVLSTFCVTGKTDLDELQRAIEAVDFQSVARISHRFQGAAGNVSATGLCELLKTAERLAHEQRREELLMILGRLQPAWEEFEHFSQGIASASRNLPCGTIRQSPCSLETSHASASC